MRRSPNERRIRFLCESDDCRNSHQQPHRRNPRQVLATNIAIMSSASTDQVEKSKILMKTAGSQHEPGILSRLTVPAGSTASNKKFGRLLFIGRAMAG